MNLLLVRGKPPSKDKNHRTATVKRTYTVAQRFIQGRNSVITVRIEPSDKNDAFALSLSATCPLV